MRPRPHRVAAGLLAAAGLAVAPTGAAATARACAYANTPASHASAAHLRGAVVCLINRQRTSRHLPALRASSLLDRSAQRWTDAMVRGRFFAHVHGGSDPGMRISAAGYSWSAAGENIATGFATPRGVVSAWMASTGHCQNILSPYFRDVGTGVNAQGVPGYGSAATWTQDFGLAMGARAPSRNTGPQRGCPYR